jgi:hypothetical protein
MNPHVGFEVLTTVAMKSTVFWVCNATWFRQSLMFQRNISPPSSWLESKTSKKPAGCGGELCFCLPSCRFLVCLMLLPENGSDMFLQNIRLRLNYMALQAQKTVVHESLSP